MAQRWIGVLMLTLGIVPSIAAEVRSESTPDGGFRILSSGYEVVLSAKGAMTHLSLSGKEPVMRAPVAGDAWVVKAGDEWLGAGNVQPVSRLDRTSGGLRLASTYDIRRPGLSFQVRTLHDFRDGAWFSVAGEIDHREGPAINLVAFPGPLPVDVVPARNVIFPFRRGVSVRPLTPDQSLSTTIPSGFTDFVATETESGGVWSVSEPLTTLPRLDRTVRLTLQHAPGAGGRMLRIHRDNLVHIAPGSTWTCPPVLFTVGASAVASAQLHWQLGATGRFPLLAQKLKPELQKAMARSPLVKFPDGHIVRGGGRLVWDMVGQLQPPALLHVCGTMPGGHDSHYPDYLPPDPRMGSMEEFRRMIEDSRQRGLLVMPYTNPTWWDMESPTMRRIGMGAVARGDDGQPIRESYGPKKGVVVNPGDRGVQERLARTLEEFRKDLPVDLVFEDQTAARDGAPIPEGPPRAAYVSGLWENSQRFGSQIPLMTEGAWDRMASVQVGFCGNGRLEWEQPKLPAEQWLPWPLVPVMANAHVASYPHNLAGEHMVHQREEMLYNMSLGVHLAYDLNRGPGPWLSTVQVLQSEVLSRVYGQAVRTFEDGRRTTGLTRLVYGNGDEVIGNWNQGEVAVGPHRLVGRGFLFRSSDGSVVAGTWSHWNGQALPPGEAGRVVLQLRGKPRQVMAGP